MVCQCETLVYCTTHTLEVIHFCTLHVHEGGFVAGDSDNNNNNLYLFPEYYDRNTLR